MIVDKKILVLDCEIYRAPLDPKEEADPNLKYATSWQHYNQMGISCCCGVEIWLDAGDRELFCFPRLYRSHNRLDLQKAINEATQIATLNGASFDLPLMKAVFDVIVPEVKHYDILRELVAAGGDDPDRAFSSKGLSLDKVSKANFETGKISTGSGAPVLAQGGQWGALVTYCFADVELSARIWRKALAGETLIDPRDPTRRLTLRHPFTPVPERREVRIPVPAKLLPNGRTPDEQREYLRGQVRQPLVWGVS